MYIVYCMLYIVCLILYVCKIFNKYLFFMWVWEEHLENTSQQVFLQTYRGN
jgi:hypothetical protein